MVFLVLMLRMASSAQAEPPDSERPLGRPRPAGTSVGLAVTLLHRGHSRVVANPGHTQGQELLDMGHRAFGEVFAAPEHYQRGTLWRALEVLADRDFRERCQPVLDLAPEDSHFVIVNLVAEYSTAFSSGHYGGGYPDWFADPEDPLAGTDPGVWPSARNGIRFHHPDHSPENLVWQRSGAVWIGEDGLALAGHIPWTLLHEMGHTVDRSSSTSDAYGPDGMHYLDEVLTPAAAMMEGWADFVAHGMLAPPAAEGANPDGPYAAPISLRIETESAGVYEWIDPRDARPEHFLLANEDTIAAVLLSMARLAPGREAVMTAFQATQDRSPRTLPDLLRAYLQSNPGTRSDLAGILERSSFARVPEDVLETLLSGRLPGGVDPDRLPLSRAYRRTPGPVPVPPRLGTHGLLEAIACRGASWWPGLPRMGSRIQALLALPWRGVLETLRRNGREPPPADPDPSGLLGM